MAFKGPSDYPGGVYPTEPARARPVSPPPTVFRPVPPPTVVPPSPAEHCTQCGQRLEARFQFCPGCATPLAEQRKRTVPNACRCGRAYGPDDKHCGACGLKRSDKA